MDDPYQGRPGEEIDPERIHFYRGGQNLDAKSNEYKVDLVTGYLKSTHGVSVETDLAALARFGEVRRIKSVPAMLKIVQRGRRLTHFEIVPRQPLTLAE